MIGSFVAVIGVVVFAFVGLVIYPLRAALRRKKDKPGEGVVDQGGNDPNTSE